MNYQIIQNKSTSTKSIFKTYLEGAEIVYIASAFIDDFSISFLKEILSLPKSERPQIKFITGLFGRFNSKNNLLELQQLNENKHIEIRISEKPNFHWKYYSFKHNNVFTFLIGSANFTKNGFNSEGEFLLHFTEQVKSFSNSKLYSMFSKEFEDATNIKEINFDDYVERKKVIDLPSDKKVFDLLKTLKSKKKNKAEPEKLCRIIKFQFPLSPKIQRQIYEQKSVWDNNNWEIFAFDYEANYDAALKSKYLLNIFSFKQEYHMELCEIKDDDFLPIGNEHYFIATKRIKKIRITPSKENELDEINLDFRRRPKNWTEIYSNKNKQTNELIKNWFKI